jgi:hypothetical protein
VDTKARKLALEVVQHQVSKEDKRHISRELESLVSRTRCTSADVVSFETHRLFIFYSLSHSPTCRFQVRYDVLNLDTLSELIKSGRLNANETITMKSLFDSNYFKKVSHGVKLLSRVSFYVWVSECMCVTFSLIKSHLIVLRFYYQGCSTFQCSECENRSESSQ